MPATNANLATCMQTWPHDPDNTTTDGSTAATDADTESNAENAALNVTGATQAAAAVEQAAELHCQYRRG